MAPDAAVLKNLNSIVESAVALVQQLQATLEDVHRDIASRPDTEDPNMHRDNIDALKLVHDTSSLIRAHSTKLSLLLINEPFTPSAIITVVRDLGNGPIPGIATAVQVCHAERYTAVFRKELAWRCRTVLLELGQLLSKIPKDGKSLAGAKQGFKSDDKGSLALTGVLWAACDSVANLAKQGVAAFFVKKVEEWRDTLKDVMDELKEWGEEEPDEEDEDESEEGDGPADNGAQDLLDEIMNSHKAIPRNDPDKLRPRLEATLKRLRLVSILYQAIVKRRIKKLPLLPPPPSTPSTVPKKLDDAANVLESLPDSFGDLAGVFYELQVGEIDTLAEECFEEALGVSELLGKTWDGGEDEFTEWTAKFRTEIKKG